MTFDDAHTNHGGRLNVPKANMIHAYIITLYCLFYETLQQRQIKLKYIENGTVIKHTAHQNVSRVQCNVVQYFE